MLTRPGHTEAGVDLARLAGCYPAGGAVIGAVLCCCCGMAVLALPMQHSVRLVHCHARTFCAHCIAGALCEIVNPEDGSMARTPQLLAFAARHSLRCITIADLVQYRIRNDAALPDIKSSNGAAAAIE